MDPEKSINISKIKEKDWLPIYILDNFIVATWLITFWYYYTMREINILVIFNTTWLIF